MGMQDKQHNLFEHMRIILPEHREAMLKLEKESKRIQKPILDEDRLNEMAITLSAAIQDGKPIVAKVYDNYGYDELTFVPTRIDTYTCQIYGLNEADERVIVKIKNLVDVWD